MQAPGSLSAVQRHSLESAYACFKGLTAFLDSVESKLQTDEKLIPGNLRDLAGTWQEDPEFDEALKAQRELDPDLWR